MAANTPSENILDETLRYIINHVILPPQVPQHDVFNPRHELDLLRTGIKSLTVLADVVSDEPAATVTQFVTHLFPPYIQSQNAGIIVRWAENSIWFEMFELSPVNSAIMSTKCRLRRTFPGHVVAVQGKTLCGQLVQTLAKTLAKMSYQVARDAMKKAIKKGQQHDEHRDSIHPKMVAQNLSPFLTSTGKPVEEHGIRKNTRELIQWHNTRSPWRRSSMWLLIRVTLQLLFSRHELSSW
ncbi:hypothetical protein F4859DRAFT_526089 [Xylaria cf. heliscus]|nr:hypothetical protein F4859DRAFT_526089 [Xylaria cf. heliscus]